MKRLFPAIVATLIAVAPACGSASAAAPSERPAEVKQAGHVYKEQSGDLPNFHQVHPYLYRGGEPTPAGLARLKEMGIATIIDLRGHPGQVSAEAKEAQRLGMETINLPMSAKAPTSHQVKTFLGKVDAAKRGQSPGPVFVHCAHGSDRTGCLVGIWRVVNDGWGYDEAYAEMRKYYFGPKFTKLSGTVKSYAQKQTASR